MDACGIIRKIEGWQRTMGRKRIHDFITDTHNPLVGCRHFCVYCWAHKLASTRLKHMEQYKDGFDHVRLVPWKLRYVGKNQGVFVCDMGDLFGAWVPAEWISRILEALREANPTNTFFFETKNPVRLKEFLSEYPKTAILSATIETNRNYKLTKAPEPYDRYLAMRELRGLWDGKLHIAIEPMQKFDWSFVNDIKDINPDIVSVGWNNRKDFNGRLPEPTIEEADELIDELSKFTDVRLKESVNERKGIKSENELVRQWMDEHPEEVAAIATKKGGVR